MKKYIIIINLLLLGFFVNAQNNYKYKLSVSYDFGNMNYSSFSTFACDCGYDGKKYSGINLNFEYKISNKLWLKSGLSYQKTKIKATYFPTGIYMYKYYNIELISIPLIAKYNTGKYFSTELGISYRLNISNDLDTKNGVGLIAAIVFQYPLFEKLDIFIRPFLQFHDLFHTENDNYNFHIKGINTGVTYLF